MNHGGGKKERHPSPWAVVAIGAGVVFLIYLSYALAEKRWLGGADMSVVHLFHFLRGVISAVVLVGVVAWYLINRQVPVFPPGVSMEIEAVMGQADSQTRLRQHAYWFINLRWLAISVAVALIFISSYATRILPGETLVPLLVLVGILVLSNVAFTFWARHTRRPYLCIVVQVLSDLVILTGLLHFSGGVENPLFIIYSFHVIISGILLSKRTAYALALAACGLFAFLALGEFFQIMGHYSILFFPHQEAAVSHAAHNPLYVLGRFFPFTGVLLCVAYFTTLVMDHLRRNEERLVQMTRVASAERQKLDTAVNAAGAGMLLLDRDLRVLWFNKRFQEWFGRGGELLGRRCGVSNGPGDGRGLCGDCVSAQAIEKGAALEVERQINSPDQGKRFYQVTASPIRNEQGEIIQVVELIQDITARKTMEFELLQVQANLMRSERLAAVGELAAGVAHEVRTPLNSLSINLQLLKRELKKGAGDDRLRQNLIKVLGQEIERVNSVVDEFIKFCRSPKLELQEWDVNEVVAGVVQLLGEESSRAGVSIEVEREVSHPLVVRMDAGQVRQILLNLIMNGIQAMPGGGKLTIVTGMKDEGHVKIAVKDTGEGIPPENLEHIFDPFFTTKENGTGIGLTIVSRIVKEHRGRLLCRSEPRRGTTFEVILPCDDQPGDDDEEN